VASYDTTGKYGMRALQGGSLVNEIDDGFAALRNDVRDNMAGYASGTFGSRPAAGVSGRLYLATDTGELYLDTGFVWLRVSGPTPWETVLDGGIIWPASAGAASLWFSGSRGNGAAGYLAVPPLWAYRSADTPTGMAVEYRFVGAAMQNTTPNQTFTVGVGDGRMGGETDADGEHERRCGRDRPDVGHPDDHRRASLHDGDVYGQCARGEFVSRDRLAAAAPIQVDLVPLLFAVARQHSASSAPGTREPHNLFSGLPFGSGTNAPKRRGAGTVSRHAARLDPFRGGPLVFRR
jgi:hypothetical protein